MVQLITFNHYYFPSLAFSSFAPLTFLSSKPPMCLWKCAGLFYLYFTRLYILIFKFPLKQALMCGPLKATCVLVLVCLMVTPATLQDRQRKEGKGARCKNPLVRKILSSIRIHLISSSQGWENQDGFYVDGCTTYTCTQVKNKCGIWVDRPDM